MLLLTILAALIAQHTVLGQCSDESTSAPCEWCTNNWSSTAKTCPCKFIRKAAVNGLPASFDCGLGDSAAFESAGTSTARCDASNNWDTSIKDDCKPSCATQSQSEANAEVVAPNTDNSGILYPAGRLQCSGAWELVTSAPANGDTTCTQSGTAWAWSPPPDNQCQHSCPAYDSPSGANASISHQTATYPNGQLKCDEAGGWVLSGDVSTTCADNGTSFVWSNSPINACQQACTAEAQSGSKAAVIVTDSAYPNGTLSCESGWKLKQGASTTVNCTVTGSKGQWGDRNVCEPGCASATYESSHLKIEQDTSNPPDGVIICDHGWKLNGSSVATCAGSSGWSFPSDACVPGCADTTVDSFEITLDSSNPPNGTVRCTKSGYSTAGVQVAVCNTDGEAVWEFSTSCKKKPSDDDDDDDEDCGGKTPLAPILCFIEKLTGIKIPLVKVPLVPLVG